MTAEERLADLEDWLLKEYTAAFAIWQATLSPMTCVRYFEKLQTLQTVARHLITGRDDLVPVFDERMIVFAQHIDFLKRGDR